MALSRRALKRWIKAFFILLFIEVIVVPLLFYFADKSGRICIPESCPPPGVVGQIGLLLGLIVIPPLLFMILFILFIWGICIRPVEDKSGGRGLFDDLGRWWKEHKSKPSMLSVHLLVLLLLSLAYWFIILKLVVLLAQRGIFDLSLDGNTFAVNDFPSLICFFLTLAIFPIYLWVSMRFIEKKVLKL